MHAAHLPAIAALGDKVTLGAVYSRSEASASALAELAATVLKLDKPVAVYHDADPQADLGALLERDDIDAVAVALPISQQPDVVLKAKDRPIRRFTLSDSCRHSRRENMC